MLPLLKLQTFGIWLKDTKKFEGAEFLDTLQFVGEECNASMRNYCNDVHAAPEKLHVNFWKVKE